jgi:hypothetical protein
VSTTSIFTRSSRMVPTVQQEIYSIHGMVPKSNPT